jgi:hypothetical protein
MPRSPRSRKKASLPDYLHRRLNMYALAAGAAGVSALALAQPAQAKVIYTQTWIPIAPVSSVTNLDLNNDGIADFQVSVGKQNKCGSGSSYCYMVSMKVLPQNPSNLVWGANGIASALGSGVSIGSQGKFQQGNAFMGKEALQFNRYSTVYGSSGPWRETTRGFLGLKFIIQGQVHYGWARLNVTATTQGMYGAISGYAYETEANKPILTGQKSGAPKKRHDGTRGNKSSGTPAPTPGGLGMLAGGARGLEARAQGLTRK